MVRAHPLLGVICRGAFRRLLQGWNVQYFPQQFAVIDCHPVMLDDALSKRVRGFRVDPRGMSEEDVIVAKFKEIVAKEATTDNEKADIAVEAMRSVSQLSHYSIANIFNCCKKGKFIHKDLFELIAQWMKMHDDSMIRDFSSIELTMTIQSIGMLAHSERRLNRIRLERFPNAVERPVNKAFFPGCKELFDQLMREFIRRDEEDSLDCDARSIADVIHGVGLWFHKKEGRPIEKVTIKIVDIALRIMTTERIFRQCTPKDLSNICFGCGSMEYAELDYFRSIMDQLQSEFKGVTPSALRSGTWECGNTNSYALSLDVPSISNIVWGMGKVKCAHKEVLLELGKQLLKVLQDADEQSLANIIYGYALAGFKDTTILAPLVQEMSHKSRMMHYREMDLANIVYAFGQLDHLHEPALQVLCKEISKPTRMRRFKEQEISNIFHGLARLKFYDQTCLDALGDAVCEMNVDIPLQGLMSIVNASGRLKYFNKRMMEKMCRGIIQRQTLLNLKETHIASTVLALSRLQYFDAQVMAALAKVIHKKLGHGNFTPKDLANLVYGLGSLEYRDERISFWLNKILQKSHILKALNSQGFCGIVYGMLKLRCCEPATVEALRTEANREGRKEELSDRERKFAYTSLQKMQLAD